MSISQYPLLGRMQISRKANTASLDSAAAAAAAVGVEIHISRKNEDTTVVGVLVARYIVFRIRWKPVLSRVLYIRPALWLSATAFTNTIRISQSIVSLKDIILLNVEC